MFSVKTEEKNLILQQLIKDEQNSNVSTLKDCTGLPANFHIKNKEKMGIAQTNILTVPLESF